MATLEICCFGAECALVAERAGADRIELCTSPSEGGITPSFGMLRQVRDLVRIPVHPIIRPRGGDFCYTQADFSAMKNDISLIRDMGFPGAVVGLLNEEGHIDLPKMEILMELAGPLAITFHRAFDMCINPLLGLEQLTQLGVSRILTSGQQANAELGLPLLRTLNEKTQGPVIMAGAGVRLSNIQKFLDAGLKEIHSSAGKVAPSTMIYRKAGVTMSSDSEVDEFTHYCVDEDTVEAMKDIMSIYTPLAS
ncbi:MULTISPECIES: copper homeostasis protein CutC [Proteus]|uniref:PF03932 family protein CutC n=1 Tax=Proteus vulgaris TaxID=585 RepID=A0A6G6SKN1_PROVU|nr:MULTISPECIES: copper homeostasis protein CutC [Proteus]MBQ0214664.1 copper homeostasis protein CutC [Proteus vulgaris]QIF94240.1 copper homeostasis protein CutC [Proteus vulgaris]WIF74214.1 copper homeostasis protein CutC [Proteus vulgaris]CRL59773.1 Copper homeostasis protein CutC [Proteus vulgaris]SUC01064.1 copper homeostasis protein CutC [Proteus vulgaris]